MEVILLEKIRHLGGLGDTVKVKPGFGRNFLIPKGKAVSATAANLVKFEARRAELEKAAAEVLRAAQVRHDAVSALGVIVIKVKAGDEGKLFGSIGTHDIAEAVTAAGAAIEKHEVHLPYGALRQVGEYDIAVELHGDLTTIVKINLVSDAPPAAHGKTEADKDEE